MRAITVGYGPQPSLHQATGRPAERAWACCTAAVSNASARGPLAWATTKRLARSRIRQPQRWPVPGGSSVATWRAFF